MYLDADAAIAHALELVGEGADIVDVGGESTRPGAEPVSGTEELRRVLPVVEGIVAAATGAQVSIDTSKAAVARAALDGGRDARQRRERAARPTRRWLGSWRRAGRSAA